MIIRRVSGCTLNKNRLDLCMMPLLFNLFFLLVLFPLHGSFILCSELNAEGLALLRFRDGVVRDPLNALSSWNRRGEDTDPCSWFGVQCSDGNVVALNLKDMSLRGTLTPDLGKLAHLKYILLRNNSFYGTIPREIVELKELEVLDLGYNDFTGPLPFEFGDSNISLAMISLDNNRFLDCLFTEQYKFMLSENQVDEHKPSSASPREICDGNLAAWNMGHFPAQRVLLEASNPKPPKMPSVVDSLPPQKSPPPSLRSSNNPPSSASRKGSLAAAPSPSASPSSKHNPSTPPPTRKKAPASPPKKTPSPASPSHKPPPPPTPSPTRNIAPASPPKTTPTTAAPVPSNSSSSLASKSSHKSHAVVIGLSVGAGTLAIIVAVTAIIFCRSSRMVTVKPWATGLSGPLQKAFVSGVSKLKRAELETACEDFSNIIGNLTDSTVYKGTLSNGVEIAVVSTMDKSSLQWSKQLQTQFKKKIEMLSKVNHKNFVNVLGYCEQEKPFTRMMVFEYAPNGTLFEHLHVQEAERLDWRMRLQIIMGMAYCLEHMHQLDPPIPHRDLHSSSVHLSVDYAAKVSDFSFWTEATSKKMNSSSMRSPSMQLLEGSVADTESNVHSFGVLLFEIITGKIPFTDDGEIEDWVWEYLGGNELPREAIDPTLNTFQEEEIQKMFEIMKDCVNPDATERPTMKDVVVRLKEVIAMEPGEAAPSSSPLWWAELEILTT